LLEQNAEGIGNLGRRVRHAIVIEQAVKAVPGLEPDWLSPRPRKKAGSKGLVPRKKKSCDESKRLCKYLRGFSVLSSGWASVGLAAWWSHT